MDDINGRKEIIFSNDILIFSSLQRYASKWGINYFCKASSSLMINVIVYMCILLHLFQTRIKTYDGQWQPYKYCTSAAQNN